jgi:hypothetical protein
MDITELRIILIVSIAIIGLSLVVLGVAALGGTGWGLIALGLAILVSMAFAVVGKFVYDMMKENIQ